MSIIRCSRKDCGGFLIKDDDRLVCSLCARSPNTPAPLPMTASAQANGSSRVNYRYRNLTPEEIATIETATRERKAEWARERRKRERAWANPVRPPGRPRIYATEQIAYEAKLAKQKERRKGEAVWR